MGGSSGRPLTTKRGVRSTELREAADGHAPSTLRILDVATWMRFSESDRARKVRKPSDSRSADAMITDEEVDE